MCHTSKKHIYVALGANLESRVGPPRVTLERALQELESRGINVRGRSRWYKSPAFPDPTDPEFINGMGVLETALQPRDLLSQLHEVERVFGRERRRRWAPRILDLDVIDYRGVTLRGNQADGLVLPHPEMSTRDFVLLPLRDVAPDWRHPETNQHIDTLIDALNKPLSAIPLSEEELSAG